MATLGPRAVRDVQRGVDEGRFRTEDVSVAVDATGGALIGTMQGVLDGTLGPETSVLHAASVLRMLGVEPDDALAVACRPAGR